MKLLMTAAVVVAVACAALGLSARPRFDPIQHFAATSAELIRPGRPAIQSVDISVTSWTTAQNHRLLMRTLLEKGPNAFADRLCYFFPVGSIGVLTHPDVPIRYAWQTVDREQRTRVYLATDASISLAPRRWLDRGRPAEALTFVELRLDRTGKGEGKLADVMRLSADESLGVIELRDYEQLPVQLVRVERLGAVEH